MRHLAIAALAVIGAATVSDAQPRRLDDPAAQAARLAQLTRGLVPQGSQTCLTGRIPTSIEAVGDKLVYKVNRRLLYVNQTTGGCERVARDDVLVTTSNTRVCAGDIAQTFTRYQPVFSGSCALGQFVRYAPAGK